MWQHGDRQHGDVQHGRVDDRQRRQQQARRASAQRFPQHHRQRQAIAHGAEQNENRDTDDKYVIIYSIRVQHILQSELSTGLFDRKNETHNINI